MNMAVSLAGRERRLDDYAQLFAETGLALIHVRETAAEWSLLEARRGDRAVALNLFNGLMCLATVGLILYFRAW